MDKLDRRTNCRQLAVYSRQSVVVFENRDASHGKRGKDNNTAPMERGGNQDSFKLRKYRSAGAKKS